MAAAYEKLGYENVHHGIAALRKDWDHRPLNRACERTFPKTRPWYRTPAGPLTAKEWDDIFGEFGAITDVACLYWKQLVETYPDAKVVLVERPVEKWYKSFDDTVIDIMFSTTMQIYTSTAEIILGDRMATAWIKSVAGYFNANTKPDLRARARSVYHEHYEQIRATVPKEQLLDYELGSGWEPLCKFLGKEIPDEDFPRVNDTEAMQTAVLEWQIRNFKRAGRNMVKGLLFCGVAIAAVLLAEEKFHLGIARSWPSLQWMFLKSA